MCRPAPVGAAARQGQDAELADVFRLHGGAYRRTHALAACQLKAMRAIEACRTARLGGHKQICDTCGAVRVHYNSCRNRHCPKCQGLARERWLQARRAELLEIEYFHVVFTLPHEINALAQGNPRVIYNLLFRAAADTLLSFGKDPEHLGGTLGITAVLHTWGQNLSQHIHLHCIVTGGALSADQRRWIAAKPGFLFPVRALSKVFRGKYLEALGRAYRKGKLKFSAGTAELVDESAFSRWVSQLRDRPWVVYCKSPVAGPEQVVNYLGRYTHRIAISNHRIVAVETDTVQFTYRDYADGGRCKLMSLQPSEFIRRFLLHVVRDGFRRIRHFGILAHRDRSERLARCRELLGQPQPPAANDETTEQIILRLSGIDILRCPVCGQGRLRLEVLLDPPSSPTATFQPFDTS
jgi:hypothetical protein